MGKMSWIDQINIMRALCGKLHENLPKAVGGEGLAVIFMADLLILAKDAA
jgi:hypothetical protein